MRDVAGAFVIGGLLREPVAPMLPPYGAALVELLFLAAAIYVIVSAFNAMRLRVARWMSGT